MNTPYFAPGRTHAGSVAPGRGDDDPPRAGLQLVEVAVGQARLDTGRRDEVSGLADPAGVAAVEDDGEPPGLDRVQGRGELGAGDRRPGQIVDGRVDGVHRQQVLAGLGARLDPPAVA